MADERLKLPVWARLWTIVSIPIVIWDASFLLLRPHTFEGGKLFKYWKPYKLYSKVDLLYSRATWLAGDRFNYAIAVLNLVEVAMCVVVLVLLARGGRYNPPALMMCMLTAGMTFWKTVMYFMYDVVGGFPTSGHNSTFDLIFLYIIPNGLWVVFPFLVMVNLASQILRVLKSAQARSIAGKRE